MEKEEHTEEIMEKFIWKKSYTWVLLLNAGYIVLFYYLMKSFS
ncbi:MAG: hypothetical protein AAF489_12000 [Bacteroidota bacterium]